MSQIDFLQSRRKKIWRPLICSDTSFNWFSLKLSSYCLTSTSDNSKPFDSSLRAVGLCRNRRDLYTGYSTGFQCDLVHDQTTLSPNKRSERIYDLFLSLLHNFAISKNWHFENYTSNDGPKIRRVWFLDTLSSPETSKPCITSKHGVVAHKFNILRS